MFWPPSLVFPCNVLVSHGLSRPLPALSVPKNSRRLGPRARIMLHTVKSQQYIRVAQPYHRKKPYQFPRSRDTVLVRFSWMLGVLWLFLATGVPMAFVALRGLDFLIDESYQVIAVKGSWLFHSEEQSWLRLGLQVLAWPDSQNGLSFVAIRCYSRSPSHLGLVCESVT
jgi:hypothetical protein